MRNKLTGRRTKNIIIIVMTVILVITSVTLSGCDKTVNTPKEYKEYEMDVRGVTNIILKEVKFESEMFQVNNDTISTFIELPEIEQGYMFLGNGTKSDCFGVFKLAPESEMTEAVEAAEIFLSDFAESYRAYIPAETEKIENHSFILERGSYLVFAVTNDDENAKKIIDANITETVKDEDGNIISTHIGLRSDEEDGAGNETDSVSADGEKTDSDGKSGIITDENPVTSANDIETDNNAGTDSNVISSDGMSDASQEEVILLNEAGYPAIETEAKLKDHGGIIVIGKSAYEMYSYVEKTAKNFTRVINYAANKLEGKTDVYSMVVPLSFGVTLPDKYWGKINSSNEKDSLDKLYGKFNDKVISVNPYENLMKHRNEYIYYRTDHHWTSLGAYYAYETWCETKGLLPISPDRREKKNYGNFLGSLYYDTKEAALKKKPDKLIAYFPIGGAYIGKKDGSKKDVITDVSDYPISLKYNAFIGGDNAKTVIHNDNINTKSVCVVVKESFGNAFVPYLTDHYSKVIVLDYRYFEGNIIDFCKKNKADDLIFINNIGMTRSSYLVGKLREAVKD